MSNMATINDLPTEILEQILVEVHKSFDWYSSDWCRAAVSVFCPAMRSCHHVCRRWRSIRFVRSKPDVDDYEWFQSWIKMVETMIIQSRDAKQQCGSDI